jgi:hypothetical protein
MDGQVTSHHGDHNVPGWKVPKNYLRGYTGNSLSKPLDDDALNAHYRRLMIRGYSGFIPDARTVSGRPIIPSDENQRKIIEKEKAAGTVSFEDMEVAEERKDLRDSFKEYAKHMDLLERYADANNALLAKGQTPEMLLKLVQAKISERVCSYSEQFITVKLRFESASECVENGFNELAFRGRSIVIGGGVSLLLPHVATSLIFGWYAPVSVDNFLISPTSQSVWRR